MVKQAYKAEQVWLRAFLEYDDEVCFDLSAQRSMASFGVTITDVMYVLRSGSIMYAERDECGSMITVLGRNCDEEEIEVCARMVSEMMHVSIIKVRKALRFTK
ncbi:hypothetical protein [Rhizobium tubonense]|uniref:Uncharacterized protein n=1 Tax=Rhizobium tubonense TaxID=484088 RepID=A0A2W4C1J2_9HYPH|nr:hypothetical protein [Rhizobium tubonense]PZM07562.1 hypothetical protein CPY51_31010 [Rhizobium tubonense]